MTLASTSKLEATFGKYAPHLLETVASHVRKATRLRKGVALEQIVKALSTSATVDKIVASLHDGEKEALAVFALAPGVQWRWDHAVRLVAAYGVPSPYRSLQVLLNHGLLTMHSQNGDGTVVRFELPSDLRLETAPAVGLATPIAGLPLPPNLRVTSLPIETAAKWRSIDGWDIPIRIALLWQMCRHVPIRKTQQNQLFKRDQERILQHAHLATGLLDMPEPVADLGAFVYGLAREQGLLTISGDEEAPSVALHEFWPADLDGALEVSGRALWTLDSWNELGDRTPPGPFATETATARHLAQALLATLPLEAGTTVEAVASAIAGWHPPFDTRSESMGPLRQVEARVDICRRWTRATLLGPMYQLGIVEVGESAAGTPLVRLSSLGRRLLGFAVAAPPRPQFEQTLFVQPNHSIVVYRQGLTIELLSRLIQFAEARSVGAALTFELTADSVYRGLEAGLTSADMVELLARHGGRDIPSGVAASIETWSQKRERLTVHASASLLEFDDPGELERAVAAGLDGVRLADRILLLATEHERKLAVLRLVSTRDYRLPPEPCVEPADDGVTLTVDMERSDLLLDAELQRFAAPTSGTNGASRGRSVRITPETMRAAVERGLTAEALEDWFQRRTGDSAPASVKLLLHATNGLQLPSTQRWIVRTALPEIADGLLQHPVTMAFFAERLGPTHLAVADGQLEELRKAALDLGVSLEVTTQSEGRT